MLVTERVESFLAERSLGAGPVDWRLVQRCFRTQARERLDGQRVLVSARMGSNHRHPDWLPGALSD